MANRNDDTNDTRNTGSTADRTGGANRTAGLSTGGSSMQGNAVDQPRDEQGRFESDDTSGRSTARGGSQDQQTAQRSDSNRSMASGNDRSQGSMRDKDNRGNQGFASMDQGRQREIAAQGGRAAHASGNAHEFNSAEAREAGRKGGQASGGNTDNLRNDGSDRSSR